MMHTLRKFNTLKGFFNIFYLVDIVFSVFAALFDFPLLIQDKKIKRSL